MPSSRSDACVAADIIQNNFSGFLKNKRCNIFYILNPLCSVKPSLFCLFQPQYFCYTKGFVPYISVAEHNNWVSVKAVTSSCQ